MKELLLYNDATTTMIYTHVLNRGASGVRSPLDAVASPGPRAPFEASEPPVSDQRGPREFAAYAAPQTSFAVSTTSSSFAR